MGTEPPPQKGGIAPPQIFGPCLLWPNGWMDQDGTWHGGRPQPRRLCVRWGPSPLSKKGAHPSPIFGKFLLCPKGWMHHDATSYGGRPQPSGLCVRCGPSPLLKKWAEPPPQFSAHVYCGPTAGWIKVALGVEVGLDPGHIVLDGEPARLSKKAAEPSPIFGPFLANVNSRSRSLYAVARPSVCLSSVVCRR